MTSAEHSAEIARPLLADHQPAIGTSTLGAGIVGCACMTTREFYGYAQSHGGPTWLAYADHIAAQVSTPPESRAT